VVSGVVVTGTGVDVIIVGVVVCKAGVTVSSKDAGSGDVISVIDAGYPAFVSITADSGKLYIVVVSIGVNTAVASVVPKVVPDNVVLGGVGNASGCLREQEVIATAASAIATAAVDFR
jgi:hypothetical protein